MKSLRSIALAATLLVVAACGGTGGESGPSSTLERGLPSDPETLDQHKARSTQAAEVLRDVGEGLIGYSAIGELEPELIKIAEVVRAANRAAREIAAPGVAMQAVDEAAREVISAAGYGPYFTHRTGHGLGMQGHEPPYIRGDNEQLLEPGMTFTIEPGIYLPGRGGVRIEDDVLVTEDGLESFTDMARGLVHL